MDRQTIFDTVVNHLFTQGRPAVAYIYEDNYCMYRSTDGLKCAVGCLIPDEMYTKLMEQRDVYSLLDGKETGIYSLPDFINTENAQFLRELQTVHDGSNKIAHDGAVYIPFTTEYLNKGLSAVASVYNLKYDLR